MGYEKHKRPILGSDFVDDHPHIGGLYVEENATATVIAETGTAVTCAGTHVLKAESRDFISTGTALQFKGPGRGRLVKVTMMCSILATANDDVRISIGLNGVVLNETHMDVRATQGQPHREVVATQGIVQIEPNDIIGGMLANLTSTDNITMHDCVLIIEPLS